MAARPMTSSTQSGHQASGQSVAGNDIGTEKDLYTRAAIIHTGPDGLRPHNKRCQDAAFVGNGVRSHENTSALSYMFRPPPGQKFPKAKNGRIGETGWEREVWDIKKAI